MHTHTQADTHSTVLDFGLIDGREKKGAEIHNLLKRMRPSGIFSKVAPLCTVAEEGEKESPGLCGRGLKQSYFKL